MSIRLWGNERLVNITTLNSQSVPVVTNLQNGGYVTAWVGAAASACSSSAMMRLASKSGLKPP
jgi:hypothetical protein